MALFAPVAPASLLRAIKDKWKNDETALGHYHLVLAHDIVENKKEWRGLLPGGSTIIIDNSVIELGSATSIEAITEAYHFFREENASVEAGASAGYKLVIVPPETLDDAYQTYIDFEQGWEKLKHLYSEVDPEFSLMYVVQGKTIAEINESFDFLSFLFKSMPIGWIGIPRRLVDNVGTRAYAVARAMQTKLILSAAYQQEVKIHLLGFSNNIRDDIYCARLPWIYGIDSAVPLRLGQKKIIIDFQYQGDQAGPRNNFWEEPGELDYQTIYNLGSIRSVIRPAMAFASNYIPKLDSK